MDLVQFEVGSGYRVRHGGRARAPHIHPIFGLDMGGCRSARAFEARLRRPSWSKFHDRSVTGRAAWGLRLVRGARL